MQNEELDLKLSHTYFLELVGLTFCKEDFDYEMNSTRPISELAALAVLGSNDHYLQSLQTMEEVLVGSEVEGLLSPSDLKTHYAEAKELLFDIEVLPFTYHEVHKLLKLLFGKKVDKAFLRKTLETLVSWEWLAKTHSGEYTLPMHHITNSATLHRLSFDEGVMPYSELNAVVDDALADDNYVPGAP